MGARSLPTGPWSRIAAIAVLAATSGCGGAHDEGSRPAAATPPAARLDLGVVAVTARVGGDRVESAGVVLDSGRGLILTTAHDVWGARSLKVSTGIAVLHGRIVARDACDDLAVLETQPRLPGLVAVRPSSDGALLGGRPIVAVRRRSGLPSSTRARPRHPARGHRHGARPRARADAPAGGGRARRAPALPPRATGSPAARDRRPPRGHGHDRPPRRPHRPRRAAVGDDRRAPGRARARRPGPVRRLAPPLPLR